MVDNFYKAPRRKAIRRDVNSFRRSTLSGQPKETMHG
jgi:hypothetical protein